MVRLLLPPYKRLRPSLIGRGLTRNLISHWRLNEASGNALDSWGANTLTDNATVTATTGPNFNIPAARQFTAANTEFFNVGTNASLEMVAGNRMAITAWVYLDSNSSQITIAGKWNAVGNQRGYLLDYLSSGTRFRFIVSPDGTTNGNVTANAIGNPATGVWYFLAGWYDGVNLYASANGTFPTATPYTGDVFTNTADFKIGAINASSNYWDGRIASVSLWKRALNYGEVVWLWNGGFGRLWAGGSIGWL